ncbi:hypothetical protein Tco_0429013 [Tanacetum coccineum]
MLGQWDPCLSSLCISFGIFVGSAVALFQSTCPSTSVDRKACFERLSTNHVALHATQMGQGYHGSKFIRCRLRWFVMLLTVTAAAVSAFVYLVAKIVKFWCRPEGDAGFSCGLYFRFPLVIMVPHNVPERGLQLEIPEFRDTLIQHMESTTEDKVDSEKALDLALLIPKAVRGTALKEQDTSSRSGNDAHADDADIRPIYDEEPMAEVHTTAEINIFATGKQHTEQPKFNNKGEVDQNAEQCHDTCPLPAH